MLPAYRFGETIGSPVAIEIATEWLKWTEVRDPLDHDYSSRGTHAPLSRVHARAMPI